VKVYLAGPMTGISQFNFPAFDAAAESLRARGFEVVSPAELDDPETRAAALASDDGAPGSGTASDETWGDFLARDVKLIADGGVEAIVVLPRWEGSRGARLETFIGNALCGLPIFRWGPHDAFEPIPAFELVDAWGDTASCAAAALVAA
jgi:hypothetical protein